MTKKSIGVTMVALSWIVIIIFFAFIFDVFEKRAINPNTLPESVKNSNNITLKLKANKMGHYLFDGKINGITSTFLVDTGATSISVPVDLAKKIGLLRGRAIKVNTANGQAIAYQTRIDELQLGKIKFKNVKAYISPGLKGEVLLGMSILKKMHLSQKNNQLILTKLL